MYRSFMSQESSDFVARALAYLAGEVGAQEDDGSFWVCYGSFVLNQQTPESDLDLLYIHNRMTAVRRIQSSFEGRSVTVYSLSRNNFASDGEQGLFGGYFGGKVLNPHAVLLASQEDKNMVAKVGGAFIGPFAAEMAKRQERKIAMQANLVADSVLARFHLCPWYQSYFLRYYILPVFPQLWERMNEAITSFFIKAQVVTQEGDGFRYCPTLSDEELHRKTIVSVARFWALGSSLHGGMPDFPAFYMQKAEQYIRENHLEVRCEEMMQFLRGQSVHQNEGGCHGI